MFEIVMQFISSLGSHPVYWDTAQYLMTHPHVKPLLCDPITLMIGGAAIIGGGSVVGGLIGKSGADKAAEAADRNSAAQIAAAKDRQDAEIAERRRIETRALEYAKKSPEEIAAFSSLLKTKEAALSENRRTIDQQYEMLNKFDPTIQESGNQLLTLLKGESSRYLDPVMQQRQLQKSKLESTLARTMGPGWRTSSAGIEAVTRFDQQTFEATSQIQSNALNQVASIYSGGVNLRNQTIGTVQDLFKTNVGLDQSVIAAEDAVKRRQIAAVTGAASVAPINFGALQDASKSVGSGDIIRGNSEIQMGNAISGVASSIGGQMIGGAMTQNSLNSLFSKTPSPAMTFGDVSGGSSAGLQYPSLGVRYN